MSHSAAKFRILKGEPFSTDGEHQGGRDELQHNPAVRGSGRPLGSRPQKGLAGPTAPWSVQAVGAGLTSLYFLDNECHDDPVCYQAVAVYGGIGAIAGLGIDALIHRNVVVYTSRPSPAPNRITVAPIIARGRNGVRLMIAF